MNTWTLILSLLLFIGITLPVLGLSNSLERTRDKAVFFAISDYEDNHNVDDLINPIRDAEAIANLLATHYNFDTIIYRNSTEVEIMTHLRGLQKEHFVGERQLLIFFSGHGSFREFSSQGYFIPNGEELNNFDKYIELVTLGRIIANIPCKHTLLAIDACYSGTIDEKIAFRSDKGRRDRIKEKDKRLQYLRSQWEFPSQLFITSGGKERTPDGEDHSPFSTAILKALKETISMGDGMLGYEDLLSYLSRVDPTPHKGTLYGHEGGGFVFVSNDIADKRESLEETYQTTSGVLKIEGSVVDENRMPIEGVSVFSDTGEQQISDEKGRFSFSISKNNNSLTLSFSSEEYKRLSRIFNAPYNNIVILKKI